MAVLWGAHRTRPATVIGPPLTAVCNRSLPAAPPSQFLLAMGLLFRLETFLWNAPRSPLLPGAILAILRGPLRLRLPGHPHTGSQTLCRLREHKKTHKTQDQPSGGFLIWLRSEILWDTSPSQMSHAQEVNMAILETAQARRYGGPKT